MVSSHLDELRSCADLIVAVWFDVVDFFAGVKKLASSLEVVFHKVDVFFIVLHVYSRVPNDQNAELVEAFSYLLALNSGQFLGFRVKLSGLLQGEESSEVDDGHLRHFFADNFSAFAYLALYLLVDGLFDLD